MGADGTDSPRFGSAIRRFPQALAGLEVIGQHPPVLGATKQHAVQVGGAAVGRQKAGRVDLARAPILAHRSPD